MQRQIRQPLDHRADAFVIQPDRAIALMLIVASSAFFRVGHLCPTLIAHPPRFPCFAMKTVAVIEDTAAASIAIPFAVNFGSTFSRTKSIALR